MVRIYFILYEGFTAIGFIFVIIISLGGIVAASIRDSLELATKLGPDNKKNVRWDKLYYNDDSVAEARFQILF